MLLGTLILGCSYVPLSVDPSLQSEFRKGDESRQGHSLGTRCEELPAARLRFLAADAALSLVVACPQELQKQAELCHLASGSLHSLQSCPLPTFTAMGAKVECRSSLSQRRRQWQTTGLGYSINYSSFVQALVFRRIG